MPPRRLEAGSDCPDIIAFRNILRSYEQEHGLKHGSADYAILDVGDRKIDLHFFSHGEYEVTRSLETGCHELMKAISELTGGGCAARSLCKRL